MPFFVSQKMQISSKISSRILYFANILPVKYDCERTFIATLSSNSHVLQSVLSLLPRVWSYCRPNEHFFKNKRSIPVPSMSKILLLIYWFISMIWILNIRGKIIKSNCFADQKWEILLNLIKNQYFRHKGGFSSFRQFLSKTKFFWAYL